MKEALLLADSKLKSHLLIHQGMICECNECKLARALLILVREIQENVPSYTRWLVRLQLPPVNI